MSGESNTTGGSTLLVLIARPGIAIRLLNGALEECASGTERLELQMSQGLYMVEWSSAGQQSQTMVSLDGRKDRIEVRFDPSDIGAEAAFEVASNEKIALVDAVNSAIRPSERNHESSIVLIVSGEPEALEQAGDLQLRLFDRNEVKMRANRDDAPLLTLATSEQSNCYRVRPGRYHVGFHSILGDHLGQSVPALAGRQTLIFLTVTKTKLVVADIEKFRDKDNVGIDPVRSTIVTVRGDEDDYRVRERVRLAGLLLFDLGNGTNSLTPDVVAVLDDPETDPLLRLYGTLVALSALERSLASGSPTDLERYSSFEHIGADRLRRWIGDPGRPGLPTDAVCAAWELRRLQARSSQKEDWANLPTRIETPPMLECSWRWAIEESVANPDAVRGAAVVATARSAGGTMPWLCWQIAATKARFVPVASTTSDLPHLISQVADKVGALFETDSLPHTIAQGLESFSPEIQATALRAVKLVANKAVGVSGESVAELAVALGLPSRLLHKRLVNTSAALDEAALSRLDDNQEAAPVEKASGGGEPAPAMQRAIRLKDDLQKGRFGGKSSRKGFSVEAEFKETASKNWSKIELLVTGPARHGEEVQFYLHDSFKPPMITRKFNRATAKLSVTIWGGFTLGVWIPGQGIELELDLAKLNNAPPIVRER